MLFTKEQTFEMCKKVAPIFEFDPLVVMTFCVQEAQKDEHDSNLLDAEAAGLEQGFYRKFVRKNPALKGWATSSKVLMASSYGVMQEMGLCLFEDGYIDWYFNQATDGMKQWLQSKYSQMAIPSAIDAIDVNLEWMITWGCKHLAGKRKAANGDTKKMVLLWNGGGRPAYYDEWLEKYETVKKEFGS